jgi:phosphomannomutase
MKWFENIKIGISGLRGIVGETLTPDNIIDFTRAFSTIIRKGNVAVAKDSRISGDTIKRAVFSGLIYSGITPVDTFTLPTPSLGIFVKARKLNGGIIITASHNPEKWNGLKFVNQDGLFLRPFNALNLIDIYHQRSFIEPKDNIFPTVEEERDAFRIHMRKIHKLVDMNLIKKKRFRVLIDPGGGVGSIFTGKFLEYMGCKVDMINNEIGARFPRNPEPTIKNLEKTSQFMRKREFDVGFAQDPDGDRLSVLDECGQALGGELTLALALYGYLSKERTGKIVVNFSTSRIIEHIAQLHGIKVVKSPVGEINVVETMIKEGAVAGGEGNGGIIIPKVHHCRDSFTGMALVLDVLAKENKKVSEIVERFPSFKIKKVKIPFSITGAHRVICLLKEEYPEANTLDGLRVDKEKFWFHIRPSNTEPVLRIIAEGDSVNIEKILGNLIKKIQNMGE